MNNFIFFIFFIFTHICFSSDHRDLFKKKDFIKREISNFLQDQRQERNNKYKIFHENTLDDLKIAENSALHNDNILDLEGEFYVSMTASLDRFKNIKKILTILEINKPENDLYKKLKCVFINLPFHYRDKPENIYDINELIELKNLFGKKVQFNFIEKDFGPITKILPTALKLNQLNENLNTVIISIDDDKFYIKNHLLLLYSIAKKAEGVFAYSGGVLEHWGLLGKIFTGHPKEYNYKSKDYIVNNRKLIDVDIVCGYSGIAYKLKYLDMTSIKKIYLLSKISEDIKLSDDLMISLILSENNVNKYKIYEHIRPSDRFNYQLVFLYLSRNGMIQGNIPMGELEHLSKNEFFEKYIEKDDIPMIQKKIQEIFGEEYINMDVNLSSKGALRENESHDFEVNKYQNSLKKIQNLNIINMHKKIDLLNENEKIKRKYLID